MSSKYAGKLIYITTCSYRGVQMDYRLAVNMLEGGGGAGSGSGQGRVCGWDTHRTRQFCSAQLLGVGECWGNAGGMLGFHPITDLGLGCSRPGGADQVHK